MYVKFKRDPYVLQKYNIISLVGLLSLIAILLTFFKVPENIYYFAPLVLLFSSTSLFSIILALIIGIGLCGQFYAAQLVYVPIFLIVSFVVGIWCNVLIHNCAHNNIKPKWLNNIIGELCGLHLLSGFVGFAILHIQHHIFSDGERDPHPNLVGQSFWNYVNVTRKRLRETFMLMYREQWGHDQQALKSFGLVKPIMPINRILRAFVWLLALKPALFCLVFIPSHIVTQLAFGVINYYSHRRQENGDVEIVNLDYNIIYRVLNRLFAGAFYHKNHHLKPYLFNPMNLKRKSF